MIEAFQQEVVKAIASLELPTKPAGLYQPISYLLNLGGKRIRPTLALLGNKVVGGDGNEALPVATAVEVFHNFTLMHDDIMDQAPVRRGQPSVHAKWNVNTAILSGDVMLVKAYQEMAKVPADVLPTVLNIFNETAVGVCEGQQMDMDFETAKNVSIEQYLDMIGLKTAILLSGSLRMGAAVAHASTDQLDALDVFGYYIGRAFQLQDDYLDAFGDPAKVGKQVGGDILANKQTFLLLKCMEVASPEQRAELQSLMLNAKMEPTEKVAAVKALFTACEVDQLSAQAMDRDYQMALDAMKNMEGDTSVKKVLIQLAEQLMNRVN